MKKKLYKPCMTKKSKQVNLKGDKTCQNIS